MWLIRVMWSIWGTIVHQINRVTRINRVICGGTHREAREHHGSHGRGPRGSPLWLDVGLVVRTGWASQAVIERL
jgi:hypothetical protein